MKLKELATFLDGEIISGNDDIEITGVSGINDAGDGDITFLSSKKYLKDLAGCKAACVLVLRPLPDVSIPQLKVANPYLAFAKMLEHFHVKPMKPAGISRAAIVSEKALLAKDVTIFPSAYIAAGVSIGAGTVVYPHVFIGEDTTVGEGCILYPQVTVREGVTIGNRVIIHSGAVIGSDGFGYVFDEGIHYKIPQVGGVIIEDDVEIGSNASIDRATTGNTIIGKGTKIDNLSQIAHNVKIGQHTIIVAQAGIGGSTEIGDYVTLAGQVGVADHTVVESGTMIGAQSGIMGHIAKGAYSGSPAIPHRDWLRAQALYARLPEMQKKIRELEAKIENLERRNKG